MSTEGAKRTMPVPPPKPKIPTPPPKPSLGDSNNASKISSSMSPDGGQTQGSTAGMGRGGPVLPPQPHLAHRRVASASPTSESTIRASSSAPSVTPKPNNGPPPKVAPKPPNRRSGAHQNTNPYETAKSNETHGDGALEKLMLSPAQLKTLADEYSVGSNELSSLQLLFIEMDTDNDGVISIADLLRYKYGIRKMASMEEAKEKEIPNPACSQQEESTSRPPMVGILPSASAPHLSIQVKEFTEDGDSSDGEEERSARDEIGDILKGMDLSDSSSEETPRASADQPPPAQTDAPKQGFSFRHIDFASLPQNAGEDSGDDDNLLADWDGPTDESPEEDTKSNKSKGSSMGGFGGFKRKLSSKASMLAKKIGK